VPSSAKQRGLSEREALALLFSFQRKNQKIKNNEIFILGVAEWKIIFEKIIFEQNIFLSYRCIKYLSQNQ
jgi:hypothetical protein